MKNLLLKILHACFKVLRIFGYSKNVVAVIAPASYGSLGDQALMQGLYNELQNQGSNLIEIMVLPYQQPQVINGCQHKFIGPYVRCRSSIVKILWHLVRVRSLVVLGADTLDGRYNSEKNHYWMEICDSAIQIGVPTYIVSFSFSENPVQSVVKRINEASDKIRFCSRDNYSRERFNRLTNKNANQSADLAFLMNPESDNKIILKGIQWCISMRSNKRLVVALNANYLGYRDGGQELLEAYVEVLLRIQKTYGNLAVVFIPHDFREGQSDEQILQRICDQILHVKTEFPLFMAKGPFHCWDAKKLVGYADFLVTGRMHLAIGALSQGVPAYCITYRDKFEGLMAHFGLTNNLLSRDNFSAELLFKLLQHAILAYKKDREKLTVRLSHVKELAKVNLPF